MNSIGAAANIAIITCHDVATSQNNAVDYGIKQNVVAWPSEPRRAIPRRRPMSIVAVVLVPISGIVFPTIAVTIGARNFPTISASAGVLLAYWFAADMAIRA